VQDIIFQYKVQKVQKKSAKIVQKVCKILLNFEKTKQNNNKKTGQKS